MKPTLSRPLLDVLGLTAAGYSSIEQAEMLHLSVAAVKARRTTMIGMFGARDRAHLVALAMQAGVLDFKPLDLDWLPAADVPVDRLVEARLGKGWTRGTMAGLLGVTAAVLRHRETGRQPFTVGLARRYAQLVGVDLGGLT
ncbi:helix-turn-helix domain-containing protein [Actinoplanes sp. CA-051413]|uniref:helix-turn-helix domain-containing protein n=1 Tax=Actinoplanes sp. CA-051413 TaxID=3239899 RepID=UPI003D972C4E